MKKLKDKIHNIISNDYAFSIVAKVFGVFLGLIYTILFSRYLGPELRGEASIITNYATIFSLVLCMGMYQAYPYFRHKYIGKKEDFLVDFVNKTLGIFLLYLVVFIGVVHIVPMKSNIKTAFLLIPFITATKNLNYVVLIEKPKIRTTASIYLYFIDILIILILYLLTDSNYILCCALLIVKEIVYFLIAFKNIEISINKIHPTLKGTFSYMKYGFVPMLSLLLMELNYRVDVLMLDGFVQKTDIGLYSLSVQIAERVWLIPDALKDILLSKLSKDKDYREVAKITRISLFAMLICVIILIVFGKPIIDILFGLAYKGTYEIMLILLFSSINMVFYKMIYTYNVVRSRRNINFFILFISALSNIVMNYLLIPHMGNIGAAISSLVSYSVCGFLFLFYFVFTTPICLSDMLLIKKNDIELLKTLINNGDEKNFERINHEV